ncbi:LCP family protein [Tuberibacillus calidus]|jgi:LCP family protein required for cell wall assembly|uniref:LCP family protein n=1 Tax=Tuberibacillus calidus TaxID=340097 RepID=UPI000402B979|nr:LCP family protein [Tuberibacillus calidus]
MAVTRVGKRKKAKRRRIIKTIVFIFITILLVVGGYSAYAFLNIYKAAKESYHPLARGSQSKYRDSEVTIGENPISILLIGVEDYSSGGKNGRADTLIVVTLNPHTHRMTMTSIPRDSRVPITSRGGEPDKINSAYAYGGVQGTVDTVENLLEIPIDYYIKIGFNGFTRAINEIGGVDVNVPFSFSEKDIYHHNRPIYFKKGMMHLNGEQALAYVRMRKSDPRGDFGRNDRQRQVIKAAINKAVSAHTLFKVDEIANIIGESVETNLKPKELYSLEWVYSSIKPENIASIRLDDKGKGEYIGSIWYFLLDDAGVQEVTQQLKQELELTE